MEEAFLESVLLAVTALVNVGVAALAGCLGALWMLRRDESAWAKEGIGSTAKVLRMTVLGLAVAEGLLLWTEAAVMSDQPLLSAAASMGQVALSTHVGHAWLIGAAALLPLAVATFLRGSPVSLTRLGVASACFAVVAAGRTWASHAAVDEAPVPVLVDWIHVLSASVWSGTVFLAAAVVLRGRLPGDLLERSDCARAVQALSSIATGSLIAVLITGTLSAWRALGGSLDPLLSSSYGRILMVKLFLVAVAVVLGAHNRLLVMPPLLASLRARTQPFAGPLTTFHRVLISESLVFLAVLVAAAALGTAPPPDIH